MKATGEVMSIGNSFEAAMMKAIRSLELNVRALKLDKLEGLYTDEIEDIAHQRHRRAAVRGGRGPAPGLLPPEVKEVVSEEKEWEVDFSGSFFSNEKMMGN